MEKLRYNKGDLLTVKVRKYNEVWITVLYMGVQKAENYTENKRLLYEVMVKISDKF